MIYLDMDDVLADFVGGMCAAHGWDKTHATSWDFHEEFGMSKAEFLNPPGGPRALFRDLAVLPWASGLLQACQHEDTTCILSVAIHSQAWGAKLQWLESRLQVASSDVILMGRSSYKQLLATMPTGKPNILIDDKEETIEQWNAQGGRGLLWPARHNRLSSLMEELESSPGRLLRSLARTLRLSRQFGVGIASHLWPDVT